MQFRMKDELGTCLFYHGAEKKEREKNDRAREENQKMEDKMRGKREKNLKSKQNNGYYNHKQANRTNSSNTIHVHVPYFNMICKRFPNALSLFR